MLCLPQDSGRLTAVRPRVELLNKTDWAWSLYYKCNNLVHWGLVLFHRYSSLVLQTSLSCTLSLHKYLINGLNIPGKGILGHFCTEDEQLLYCLNPAHLLWGSVSVFLEHMCYSALPHTLMTTKSSTLLDFSNMIFPGLRPDRGKKYI